MISCFQIMLVVFYWQKMFSVLICDLTQQFRICYVNCTHLLVLQGHDVYSVFQNWYEFDSYTYRYSRWCVCNVFFVDKQANDVGQAEKSEPCKDDVEPEKPSPDGEESTNALNRRSLSLVKYQIVIVHCWMMCDVCHDCKFFIVLKETWCRPLHDNNTVTSWLLPWWNPKLRSEVSLGKIIEKDGISVRNE